MDNILHIPVRATFREIAGKMVMVAADYAEVPAETVGQMLMQGLHVPFAEPKIKEDF